MCCADAEPLLDMAIAAQWVFRGGQISQPAAQPTPGARLIREWNGRTHFVDVIEGGYVFEAKVYPSLTAIAGKITGTQGSRS